MHLSAHTPFDVGIVHYASDTSYSRRQKRQGLGTHGRVLALDERGRRSGRRRCRPQRERLHDENHTALRIGIEAERVRGDLELLRKLRHVEMRARREGSAINREECVGKSSEYSAVVDGRCARASLS